MKNTVLFQRYFYAWAIFLPITSFLLVPSVQGTTIAYVFALASVVVVLFGSVFREKLYISNIVLFILLYILLYLLSQFGLLYGHAVDFTGINLVDKEKLNVFFRSSSITQSLYLFSGVLTFLFVKNFYKETWDRYIYIGALIIAAYGFYEITYFQVFHTNGDFVSNRMFGEHTGSWFQLTQIGSLTIERLKSLTGEPSMAAFTLLPYWIYALHKRKYLIQFIFLAALLLTTSTTAYIGIVLYGACMIAFFRLKDKFNAMIPILCLIMGLALYNPISNYFKLFLWDKFFTTNISGTERQNSFDFHLDFFHHLSLMNKLFGIGFGVIRSADMFSTLLVNVGIVGILLVTLFFLVPIVKLRRSYENNGLKILIIVIYATMMMAVSEFAYLPTWLFLGIAYNKLNQQKRTSSEAGQHDLKKDLY
ncbi:hypothetical protein D7Z26_15785 [Cohnella endophytica]|uniref:O-antigen ligase domain-containing protein n=1 Tax=Cohnella endophytica TaxID=2419778 RepID=A0A494XRC1_9BACL|nr:hypothetical protein [Cohnella endophytica]RKP53187.1 hypothetical protein D7Z26_15785 [Cohnella endophytica]